MNIENFLQRSYEILTSPKTVFEQIDQQNEKTKNPSGDLPSPTSNFQLCS